MMRLVLIGLVSGLAMPAAAQHIVIDPGHGGVDSGALAAAGCRHGSSAEEVVNLDTAQRLAVLLRAGGYEVDLTRTTDSSVELSARAQFANSRGADALVSIHANSNSGSAATGTETFRSTSASASSASGLLASEIQQEMVSAWGLRDRGAKALGLRVLRESNMPAALVELGFMNRCDPDSAFLQSSTQRQRAAQALYSAIVARFAPGSGDSGGGDSGGSDPGGSDSGLGACGDSGQCIDTSSTSCVGTIRSGLCPGSSSIRCCEPPPPCGNEGMCIDTSRTSCDGTLRSGLCPGSSSVRCCEPPENLETLSGRVVDDGFWASGISGATVQVVGASSAVTTASNGDFSLELREGSHTLRVSAPGYATREQECFTGRSCRVVLEEVDEGLPPPSGPTGRVIGVVYEGPSISRRIPGATVTAAGQRMQAMAGNAFFAISVSPGEVTVEASGAGYLTSSRTCTVRVNADTWCSVSLTAAGRGGGDDAPRLEVVETDEPPEAAAAGLPPLATPAGCSASPDSRGGALWFFLLVGLLMIRRRRFVLAAAPLLVLTQCNSVEPIAEPSTQTQTQVESGLVHVAEDIGVAAHLEQQVAVANGDFVDVTLSPDGERIALSHARYEGLSVLDIDQSYLQVLSRQARSGWMPQWAADSQSVAIRTEHSFHVPITAINLDGARVDVPLRPSRVSAREAGDNIALTVGDGSETTLGPPGDRYYLPEVSPDRSFVSFFGLSTGLYLYRLSDERLFHLGSGTHARFDPQGRWMVFERLGDDGHEIVSGDLYLVDLDDPELSHGRIETLSNEIEQAPSLSHGRLAFIRNGVAMLAELLTDAP